MAVVSADMTTHVCAPAISIREALERIDKSQYLFQVVVDQNGRLLGTITDGDVRRAMLRGSRVEDFAHNCMHATPSVGRAGDTEHNLATLQRLGSSRSFLPIVDASGVLKEIHVLLKDSGLGIVRAIIMAGGQGRRLGERTRTVPKPLVAVAGRPILEHVLARLEEAQVGDVHISVHHMADQIKAFVAARANRARVHFIEEATPLGTAGCIGLLEAAPSSPVLVVNGDVITSVEFAKVHDFHNRHGHDATICVARHEVDVPFGVVRYGDDGLFEGIDEKPRISNFIAAGVYYLSPEFTALVPRGRPMDMPELLGIGRKIGLRIGIFPIHEYWRDLGRPDDLDAAENEKSQYQGAG